MMDDNQINKEIADIEKFVKNKKKEYQHRALRNQKNTKRGRRYILITSWLATTLLALLALPSPPWDKFGLSPQWLIVLATAPFALNIAALVSSLISSSLSTWMKTGIYEEKWEKYQSIYESLDNEYFCYQSGIEEYDMDNRYKRAKLLATNAVKIWQGAEDIPTKTVLTDEPGSDLDD